MAHFNEIPFEVFINAILPILSVADVGMLAQVDTMWRDFTGDKLVWKSLYLRLTPAKILETSVHIGPRGMRARDHHREYIIFRNTGVNTTVHLPGRPFTPESTFRCTDSTWFLNNSWCCGCMPQELKSTLKSWREVRTDGVDSDDFTRMGIYGGDRDTRPYCEYVNSEWREYNRQKGLSTTTLCQNPDHYSIDTLGTLEDCKNKRSFKKATLKIFEKEKKAVLAKAAREKNAKLKKLEKARLVIQQLEQQLAEAEKIENQAAKVLDNFAAGAKLA
jgi:hypothetical protein